MSDAGLLRRVCEARAEYLALGNEVLELDAVRLVTNREAPLIYDANHASGVRAETPDAIDAVLEQCEEAFAGLGHRRFQGDPLTPPAFEARLVLEGYQITSELEMLLEGKLLRSGRPVEIRGVTTEADWESLARLTRADHEEEGPKFGRPVYAREVSEQMLGVRRRKGPALRYWLARADGIDCAFFSSWPGPERVGVVEDLFTLPRFRGRGIATALIERAVDDARERGAGPVVIGARPDDSPRHMYAALGFRPICLMREYLLRVDAGADSSQG